MLTLKKTFTPAVLFRRLLTAWLLAVTIEYLLLPGELQRLTELEGLARMSLPRILLLTCAGVFLLFRLEGNLILERWLLFGVFVILAAASLRTSFSWALLGGCGLIGAGLIAFALLGWDDSPEPASEPMEGHRAWLWITTALSAAFFLFVCVWTVSRVYSFSTPTYDFGIFSQMFYHMTESGLPMTTLERDRLLSHFQVHMSPIWYLLLPFYLLFPRPASLQVLQAAVLTSAVIPLWLLGKHRGLSGPQRMLLCAVLLLYPAFSGGTSYDIHENCFLTPLILWLFYGIERKNTSLTALSSLLTLMVKEDAAVYVAVIALWLIVKSILRKSPQPKRALLTGLGMLAFSLLWFFLVTGYLAEMGDGVMTYRYENFLYDGSSSLMTVVKSVILNPMKALYECVDTEKLSYIAMTLLPLLGLPLLTRKYERYLLLIPYLLVNLMSDYTYQHSIFFQYQFGSLACLMYLTVVNLADLKRSWLRIFGLVSAAAVCAGCFGAAVVPRAVVYPARYIEHYDRYQQIQDTLAQIPEEASVAATTFYTTFLSQRETLYDIRYASREHLLSAEFIVLGLSADYERYSGLENLLTLLEHNGYTLLDQLEGELLIYCSAIKH